MAKPWFRMYAEFASDHKVQMMEEKHQRRLVMLMCMRCCNGDETGNVTFHETEVCFFLRITREEWAETKSLLLSKNIVDEGNNLIHWDKRQYASDSSTARVQKHRKGNVSETFQKKQRNSYCNGPEQNRTEVKRVVFTPPTFDLVSAYCEERGNDVDPRRFVDFYESKGWLVGKAKMKSWEAAVRNWEKTNKDTPSNPSPSGTCNLCESLRICQGKTTKSPACGKYVGGVSL